MKKITEHYKSAAEMMTAALLQAYALMEVGARGRAKGVIRDAFEQQAAMFGCMEGQWIDEALVHKSYAHYLEPIDHLLEDSRYERAERERHKLSGVRAS